MQSRRHQRVRELLKRAVGEIIRREFTIEESGLITVNDLVVSGDLQSARVFVGIVGTEAQQKQGIARLKHEGKRLQALVGQEVILKYTPQLEFVVDDSISRGNRVIEIIEEIEGSSPAS
jgi:ribosome-binding factor A